MSVSTLRIERLAARYLVPRDHPDPAALGQRLDAATRVLPGALTACLGPHLDDASETVWLLREITVDLALDATAEPDALAACWGQAIARATLRRLDAGADGVAMFAGRAAHLAGFLCDLAGGDAWSLWYYAAFDGLRSLPVSAALRTALLADPDQGRRALQLLEPWQAARVLTALGSAEAKRILAGLAGAGPDSLPPSEAVLAGWRASPGFGLCPERLALGCWLTIARAAPAAWGPRAASVARALATLRLAVVRGVRDIGEHLGAGDLPGLYRLLGPAEAERLAPLLHLPATTRQSLATPCAGEPAGPAIRDTPFGGLFLLLPHLDEPPPAAPLLPTLLTLAACAGEDAASVFLDPLWRDLFGLPGDVLLADLPEDAFASRVPVAEAVLSRFAGRLPGFAASSPDYLRRNFLAARARVELAPDLIAVELGRPPLDLVLGLAGLGRGRLHLPWLDARPIEMQREG